jgi:hypothetical protein
MSARYALVYRSLPIEIGAAGGVIGRSAGCIIMLDSGSVSRRHARLTVDEEGVSIEDLGSSNGVLVNGSRVNGAQRLSHGDNLTVGDHQLRFMVDSAAPAPNLAPASIDAAWDEDETEEFVEGPKTEHRDVLALLLQATQTMIGDGKVDEAEQIGSGRLSFVLKRATQRRRVSAQAARHATRIAIALGEATGKDEWLDYPFELHLAAQRLIASDLMDELEACLADRELAGLKHLSALTKALRDAAGATTRGMLLLERLTDLLGQ